MEIQEKSDINYRMAGVLWGKTGCGKTTFLSSLPQPILYVMIDPDGHLSIPENCDYKLLDLSKYSDSDTITALTDKVPTLLKTMEGIKSVVVDSLTVYAERGLNVAVRKGVGASQKSGFNPTIEEPGQTAYGARRQYIIGAVSNILRATANRGFHVFFTTHDSEVTDQKGNVVEYTMMLGGKANNDVGLKLSECWYMSDHDKVRKIQIRNARMRQPCKTRMFENNEAEFVLKFDPVKGTDQPHSIETWFNDWLAGGRKKLPLPK